MKPEPTKQENGLKKFEKAGAIFGLFIATYVFALPWLVLGLLQSETFERKFWNAPEWLINALGVLIYPLLFLYENVGPYQRYLDFVADVLAP